MAVDDNSVDECGTGRHTPPPTYQTMTRQDFVNYTDYILNPQNSSTLNHTSDFITLTEISTNTKKSAETIKKIGQMMEIEDGVTNTLRAIRQMLEVEDGVTMTLKGIYKMLEVQDGLLNSLVSIFSLLLIIELILIFYNLISYPATSIVKDLKTVEKLNLSENDMQIILNLLKDMFK